MRLSSILLAALAALTSVALIVPHNLGLRTDDDLERSPPERVDSSAPGDDVKRREQLVDADHGKDVDPLNKNSLMKFYRLPDFNVNEGWTWEGDATKQRVCFNKKPGVVRSLKFIHEGSWVCYMWDQPGCKGNWKYHKMENVTKFARPGLAKIVGWHPGRGIESFMCYQI